MTRRSFASLLFVLAASSALAADDGPAPVPATSPAPAAKQATPPVGFKCRLVLENGRTLSGVVLVPGTWEHKGEKGAKGEQGLWTACAKDDVGASVRVWFVGGRDGFLVIPVAHVKSLENLGDLDAAEAKKIIDDQAAAAQRADSERDQLRKDRDEKRAAHAKDEKPDPAAEAKKKIDDDAAAKAAALLAKFPPPAWSVARRAEIQQSLVVRHMPPTGEEREFLDNFDAWKAAADAKAAAEKPPAKDDAAGAKK